MVPSYKKFSFTSASAENNTHQFMERRLAGSATLRFAVAVLTHSNLKAHDLDREVHVDVEAPSPRRLDTDDFEDDDTCMSGQLKRGVDLNATRE